MSWLHSQHNGLRHQEHSTVLRTRARSFGKWSEALTEFSQLSSGVSPRYPATNHIVVESTIDMLNIWPYPRTAAAIVLTCNGVLGF